MEGKLGRADYALEVEKRLTPDSLLVKAGDIIHLLDATREYDEAHIDYWKCSSDDQFLISGKMIDIGNRRFTVDSFGISVDGETFAMWLTPLDY